MAEHTKNEVKAKVGTTETVGTNKVIDVKKKYPFHIYTYGNHFKIGTTSLGSLANRLAEVVEDTKNKKHGEEFDTPEVFNEIETFLNSLEDLFYVGSDTSTQVELAEEMFVDRFGRTESWKNSFNLDPKNLRSNEQVKAFIVAVVSAIAERTENLANRKYGKVFTKENKVTDLKTKKIVIKYELVDNRSFRGRTSSGIMQVFSVIDKVNNDAQYLQKKVENLYASTIQRFDTKKQSNDKDKPRPKGKPSKYGGRKNTDKYDKNKRNKNDWRKDSQSTNDVKNQPVIIQES